jgi:hypothetical protein
MHRLSGMDNPEAPLAHHWLDSTHVSWGVATAGYTWRGVKLEASAFNGREPDQFHYNIQTGSLDSYALRATLNPTDRPTFAPEPTQLRRAQIRPTGG